MNLPPRNDDYCEEASFKSASTQLQRARRAVRESVGAAVSRDGLVWTKLGTRGEWHLWSDYNSGRLPGSSAWSENIYFSGPDPTEMVGPAGLGPLTFSVAT